MLTLLILTSNQPINQIIRWSFIEFIEIKISGLINTLKFLRLLKVLVAIVFSTLSYVAVFLIHLCFNASDAVILFAGSYVNNFLTKSFASALTSSHSGSKDINYESNKCYILPSKVNFPLITASIIYLSFYPLKGG